jgi:hypothetical protein
LLASLIEVVSGNLEPSTCAKLASKFCACFKMLTVSVTDKEES